MPALDPRGVSGGMTFSVRGKVRKIKMVVLRRPFPKFANVEEARPGSRACANEPQQDFWKIQSGVRWTNVFSTRDARNANAGEQRFNVLELRTRYHVGFLSVTTPNLALFS